MREETPVLVRRAEESLRAASQLLQESFFRACMSQAYYAMFYMASAALLIRGMRFKRHATIIRVFGDEFVRNHLLPSQLQAYLAGGFEERLRSDYHVADEVTRQEATEQLKRAEEFVAAIKEFLQKESQT